MRKALFLALLLVAGRSQEPRPVDVVVDAPSTLAPGSTAGLRVAAVRSKSLTTTEPVEGASIKVTLAKEIVYTGKTDARGTAAVSFRVPELADGPHPLRVEVGSAAFEQPVQVRREHKILLVTDKPVYQPGQTIHVRALALADMTLAAARDAELLFEIDDAKGNKVFKRAARTSRFGVASVDFELADEVNMCDFKIAVQMGKARSEKTVTVKKYVLPKFKVELKTEKNWYEPLALVKGHLQADYFFGKPVEGKVVLKASTFDVQFREFARVNATCDAQGRAEFEFRLPEYFTGTPLEKGNALLRLEVEVTDRADHAETVSRSLVVSPQPLRMHAIAESGKLVPGVENRVHVVVTTPDGAPVETNVTCNGKEARTSAAGFASFPVIPALHNPMVLELKAQGAAARIEIPVEGTRESILLRIDKAIYEAGQTAMIEAFSTRKTGTVFLDVVKKGQTVLTTTAELENGRAAYPLALDPSLFGAIELHAYVIDAGGDIVRDTKVAYVQPPRSLQVRVTTGLPEYRPGAACTIDFRVTDQDGAGRQAALGIIIVDESVYALQDMQPGLEKIYFTLEKELAQPKVEECVGHTLTETLRHAKQEAAAMLLANVEPPVKRWNVNTLAQRHQEFAGKIQKIYWALYQYVLSEKADVTVKDAKTGRREFRKEVLAELATKPKARGVTAEDLKDPWGQTLTIADLGRLNPAFRVEHWWKLNSSNALWQSWHTLTQKMAAGEALPADFGKDGFGDPLTLDVLAALDPAFSKENLAKTRVSLRKGALFQALLSRAIQQDVLARDAAGTWSFKPGTAAELVELEKMGAAEPAFSAANLAKLVEDHRRNILYQAILQKFQNEGAAAVTSFDAATNAWVLRSTLLDETFNVGGVLKKLDLRDAAGLKFDLAALGKESEAFRLEKLAAPGLQPKFNQIYQALRRLGQTKPGYVEAQTGQFVFPPEALDEIKATVTDPWGEKLRLVKYEKQRARWHWFPRNELLSAGPDRKFGTADDLGEEAVFGATGYPFGQRGGIGYSADPTLRHPVFGMEWEGGERDEFRQLRFKADGGGRFGGMRPEAGRMAPPAPAMAEMARADPKSQGAGPGGAGGDFAPAARVREYFPETLFWNPQVITNEDGTYSLPVTMADSITTWRLTASANTPDGLLGSTTHAIRVFQDFFVDIDFPVALTQGDRVSVPVAVFNYLKEDQKVELKVERQDWFELREEETKVVAMKPGEVKAVYFPIRVKGIGRHTLTVHARGTRVSDAVKRSVEVVPDGKMIEIVYNDRLDGAVQRVLEIPPNAIEGASKIVFKAYPGVFASVMDGLEGMLRMPGG